MWWKSIKNFDLSLPTRPTEPLTFKYGITFFTFSINASSEITYPNEPDGKNPKVYENDPLYDVIREWDEAFSLDGNLCENPTKQKQAILRSSIERRRK